MLDLNQGWWTERLSLEPLSVAHAAEMGPLLDDAALHEFTGGVPLSTAALGARYARLARRRSPGGDQLWGNWVMRLRGPGAAVGTVQGWAVAACIRPGHLTSQHVARAAGLAPTVATRHGEVRWIRWPAAMP